jgi:branched-chain amino acid transport system permease protein
MIAGIFALAAGLAGLAGMLLANQQFVAPTAGGELMFKAYVAATLGGWGRLGGAALAAVLIGLFETLTARMVSQPVAETALFVVLVAVLALRPEGLAGEIVRNRA